MLYIVLLFFEYYVQNEGQNRCSDPELKNLVHTNASISSEQQRGVCGSQAQQHHAAVSGVLPFILTLFVLISRKRAK